MLVICCIIGRVEINSSHLFPQWLSDVRRFGGLDGRLGALAYSSMWLFPQLPPVISNNGFPLCALQWSTSLRGAARSKRQQGNSRDHGHCEQQQFRTSSVFVQNHQNRHFQRMKFPLRYFWVSKKIGQTFSKTKS